MSRGELTEEGWRAMAPLLPAERGRWGRPCARQSQIRKGGNAGAVHGGAMAGLAREGWQLEQHLPSSSAPS